MADNSATFPGYPLVGSIEVSADETRKVLLEVHQLGDSEITAILQVKDAFGVFELKDLFYGRANMIEQRLRKVEIAAQIALSQNPEQELLQKQGALVAGQTDYTEAFKRIRRWIVGGMLDQAWDNRDLAVGGRIPRWLTNSQAYCRVLTSPEPLSGDVE